MPEFRILNEDQFQIRIGSRCSTNVEVKNVMKLGKLRTCEKL